jgi:hypothetical protein
MYPDVMPEIKQSLSKEEAEFKSIPVFTEKVLEDWLQDLISDSSDIALLQIEPPDNWGLWVHNDALDARS